MHIGAIGGLLAVVVCCAAPLLTAALVSLGIGSMLTNGSVLLMSLLTVVLGWLLWRFHRHRATAEPCCKDQPLKEGAKQ
jgi:membrane protein implicated in regulation of membrane protease activity